MGLTHIKTKEHDYYEDDQGRRQGEFKWYYANGQLWLHCWYKDDEYHGEYKSYHKDGSLWEHTYFEDGKEKGLKYLKIKNLLN